MDTSSADMGSHDVGGHSDASPSGQEIEGTVQDIVTSVQGVGSRHRFVARGNSALCAEAWGGVAACALPFDHSYHFSDEDHPYMDGGGVLEGRCSWGLQVGARMFEPCGWPRGWVGHGGMLPRQPVPLQTSREWHNEHIRVPDEDLSAAGGSRFLLAGLSNYRPGAAPEEEGWRRVLDALAGSGQEVTSGPWPVRLYVLRDDWAEDEKKVVRLLTAALMLGDEWCLQSERMGSARWVLFTWGRWAGLSRESVSDEMVAEYDHT